MTIPHVDPIEELRLRRWARENYVPVSQRLAEWHSIILDEMLARDDELRIGRDKQVRGRAGATRQYFVLHGGHLSLADRTVPGEEAQAR